MKKEREVSLNITEAASTLFHASRPYHAVLTGPRRKMGSGKELSKMNNQVKILIVGPMLKDT